MTNAIRTRLLAATACSLLAACASAPPAQVAKTTPASSSAREAVAILASASGSLVSGKLALVPMGDGVHVTGQVGGLKPGDIRGFHIHEKGDCSAADASSAGGHFNPAAQAHGRAGQGAHHAGDTDNLVADGRGVARVDDRLVLNGIFWRLRTGAPWADIPDRYGPHTTCVNSFNRWRRAGVWDRILPGVSAAYEGDIQMIDSSSIRVHQHAANAKKKTTDPVAWVARGAA